jgi:hypothetical protein
MTGTSFDQCVRSVTKRAIGFRDTGPRVYLILAQGGLR